MFEFCFKAQTQNTQPYKAQYETPYLILLILFIILFYLVIACFFNMKLKILFSFPYLTLTIIDFITNLFSHSLISKAL
jgi:prepilin signal peptidase PulO-like enzyme (type II secretory pathway)